jgi:hypothetical protein
MPFRETLPSPVGSSEPRHRRPARDYSGDARAWRGRQCARAAHRDGARDWAVTGLQVLACRGSPRPPRPTHTASLPLVLPGRRRG